MSIEDKHKIVHMIAEMSDDQACTAVTYFVGCFAAVLAGRGRIDIEKPCIDFIRAMHVVTSGQTPAPPKK